MRGRRSRESNDSFVPFVPFVVIGFTTKGTKGTKTQNMKTFFIETWGCQMNDLDSQRLSGSLKLRGYRRVEDEKQADVILLNTCSIREKAEQKVFSRLGELGARGFLDATAE